MVRIAVTIVAAALVALPAGADERAGPDLRSELEEFQARLALTSEQEARMESIFEEHLEAQMAILDKHDVDPGERDSAGAVDLQKMRALREDLGANRAKVETRLSGLLTANQMAEFRRIRAEQEAKLRDWLLSRHLDEIGKRLELTPEQSGRVRPVLKEHFEAQMAVLDRHGIAPDARDSGDRPGLRTLRRVRKDMGKLNKKTEERLSGVLSKAQLKTYKALRKEQRKKLQSLLSQR